MIQSEGWYENLIFFTEELIEILPVNVNIKLCIIIMWMFHDTPYD